MITYVITCMFPEHAVYYVVQSNNLEVKPQECVLHQIKYIPPPIISQ